MKLMDETRSFEDEIDSLKLNGYKIYVFHFE